LGDEIEAAMEEADPPTIQSVDVVQSIEDKENPASFWCDVPKSLEVTFPSAIDQLLEPLIV
jgi:hypothetical protein